MVTSPGVHNGGGGGAGVDVVVVVGFPGPRLGGVAPVAPTEPPEPEPEPGPPEPLEAVEPEPEAPVEEDAPPEPPFAPAFDADAFVAPLPASDPLDPDPSSDDVDTALTGGSVSPLRPPRLAEPPDEAPDFVPRAPAVDELPDVARLAGVVRDPSVACTVRAGSRWSALAVPPAPGDEPAERVVTATTKPMTTPNRASAATDHTATRFGLATLATLA